MSVFNAADGKKAGEVALPGVFLAPIRRDVVHFVHTNMAKNSRQAYAVSKYAGHQHSAISWGTGRAVARVPRISGGGTHRSGQGAFANMCRAGRMFAPTKTYRRWHRKINVNQRRYAAASAIAASAVPALVMARGHRVDKVEEIPLVLDNVAALTRAKDAIKALQAVGAYEDVEKSKASHHVRAGAGKARNRRYVERKGPLVVHTEGRAVEKAFRNLAGVDLVHVDRLSVLNLAPGGHLGRFCVWTKSAFERLQQLFGSATEPSTLKKGYSLPAPMMTNADLARIINSAEVQGAIRPARVAAKHISLKRNPLRNKGVRAKINPYSIAVRRAEILRAEALAAGKTIPKPKGHKAKKAKDAKAVGKARKAASKAFRAALGVDSWTFNKAK